jgi:hypothetical protein
MACLLLQGLLGALSEADFMQQDLQILLADRELLFPGDYADNPCLRQFLSQVALERDVQLEFSRKLTRGRVSQCRPSLGFVDQVPAHLRRCVERLHRYGEGFDPEPVRRLLSVLPADWADLMIHGVELQGPSPADTRIKLHIRFEHRPEVAEAMLGHPGHQPELVRFSSPHACHTAGFDLFHGGTTRMRNYVSFLQPGGPARDLLERELGRDLAAAFALADTVWVTWKDSSNDPFVYAVGPDATRFVDLLRVRGVDPAHLRHRGRPPYIFGAPLSQWQARELSDYNAYFMLR